MFSLRLITRCILTCFLLVLFSTPSSAQIYLTGDAKITTTDDAVVSINVNPETVNTFVTRKETQKKKLPRKHKDPIEAISKSKFQKLLKKLVVSKINFSPIESSVSMGALNEKSQLVSSTTQTLLGLLFIVFALKTRLILKNPNLKYDIKDNIISFLCFDNASIRPPPIVSF